jgi:tetratricopeptide (TPR) repeat protein
MTLYLNELAPWERKRQYYETIQLGKDVRTQSELISKSTKAMIGAQITSTNAILSSQERISEGIDNLSYGIDRVEHGIAGLQAAFEWGISEVVWQIEQNRKILRTILEVLSAPLDTQAKELRKRAEGAYANGWFDDALEDFLESERKNRYDFSIHTSIGMIYLFQKIDKDKALEYFDKAIKYAKPNSGYHTSFALLYKGLIKRDLGLIEEAERCASEAVELSPDFAEALYQNAQYNALLAKPEKSVQLLKKAIELDVNYCEKIFHEKDFEKIEPSITNLFVQLRDKESAKAREKFALILKRIDKFDSLLHEITNQESVEAENKDLRICLDRIKELMRRNSYRDYLEANRWIDGFGPLFEKVRSNLKAQLEGIAGSYDSNIYNIKKEKVKQKSDSMDRLSYIWWGIPVSILLGLRGCWVNSQGNKADIGNALEALFMIPFFCIIIIVAVYYILKAIIKSGREEVPINVRRPIEVKIDRAKQFIGDLNKI